MHVPRLLSSRLRLMILLTFCGFGSLVLYLFHLQITQMNRYFYLGQRNFLRQEKIASPRGNIVDIHGNILATNRPFYTFVWQGTGNKVLTEHQQELIQTLTSLCDLSQDLAPQNKICRTASSQD